MFKNSSSHTQKKLQPTKLVKGAKTFRSKMFWLMLIGLPVWVFVCFMAAQFLVLLVIQLLNQIGVVLVQSAALQTTLAAVVYVLALLFVIGLPWLIKRRQTTKKELGITRLLSWKDILLTPAAFVVYLACTIGLVAIISNFFPGFDIQQAQEVGFEDLTKRMEYLLAFLTLVVVAPVAEELIFRGYLFGKLKKHVPLWLAMLVTSALFGAVHGQFNVAVDTFALSMVMCGLREVTGSIWAGVLLHMLKNGIAYYFLFVNPTLLNSLGG